MSALHPGSLTDVAGLSVGQPAFVTAVATTESGTAWWTFAGMYANAGLMAAMGPLVGGVKPDNLAIKLDPDTATAEKIRAFVEHLDPDTIAVSWIATELAEGSAITLTGRFSGGYAQFRQGTAKRWVSAAYLAEAVGSASPTQPTPVSTPVSSSDKGRVALAFARAQLGELRLQRDDLRMGALDAEQLAMLLYLVQARELVNKQQDPAPALAELHVAQKDCLALSKTDAMCLTLGAQAMWVVAQAAVQTGPATVAALEDARIKAQQATESPEKYPDAWQTLAETHVRLAQAKPLPARAPHLAQARAALDRAFAINKHHAAAQATEQRLARLKSTKATP